MLVLVRFRNDPYSRISQISSINPVLLTSTQRDTKNQVRRQFCDIHKSQRYGLHARRVFVPLVDAGIDSGLLKVYLKLRQCTRFLKDKEGARFAFSLLSYESNDSWPRQYYLTWQRGFDGSLDGRQFCIDWCIAMDAQNACNRS